MNTYKALSAAMLAIALCGPLSHAGDKDYKATSDLENVFTRGKSTTRTKKDTLSVAPARIGSKIATYAVPRPDLSIGAKFNASPYYPGYNNYSVVVSVTNKGTAIAAGSLANSDGYGYAMHAPIEARVRLAGNMLKSVKVTASDATTICDFNVDEEGIPMTQCFIYGLKTNETKKFTIKVTDGAQMGKLGCILPGELAIMPLGYLSVLKYDDGTLTESNLKNNDTFFTGKLVCPGSFPINSDPIPDPAP